MESHGAKRVLLYNLEVDNLGIQYYIGQHETADNIITNVREVAWE